MTIEDKYENWRKNTLPNIIAEIKNDIKDSDKFKKKESKCYKIRVRKEGQNS